LAKFRDLFNDDKGLFADKSSLQAILHSFRRITVVDCGVRIKKHGGFEKA
jgi:hypothetical protein